MVRLEPVATKYRPGSVLVAPPQRERQPEALLRSGGLGNVGVGHWQPHACRVPVQAYVSWSPRPHWQR
jgi:hypothetical protein